jgi:hypothetical protein
MHNPDNSLEGLDGIAGFDDLPRYDIETGEVKNTISCELWVKQHIAKAAIPIGNLCECWHPIQGWTEVTGAVASLDLGSLSASAACEVRRPFMSLLKTIDQNT